MNINFLISVFITIIQCIRVISYDWIDIEQMVMDRRRNNTMLSDNINTLRSYNSIEGMMDTGASIGLTLLEEERNSTNTDDKEEKMRLWYKLIANLMEFMGKHTNFDKLYTELTKECTDVAINDIKSIYSVINSSGKGLSDLGLEEECLVDNKTYLFLEYELKLNVFFNQSEYISLYTFLQQNYFFQGLCLWPECTEFYTKFFDKSINKKLFKYMKHNGVKNLVKYKTDNNEYEYSYFPAIVWSLFGYVIFKIIISIVGFFVYRNDNEYQYYIDNDTSSSRIETSNINTSGSYILTSEENRHKIKRSTCKLIFYDIYKFFSIKSNVKCLFKLSNKIFDDKGLELTTFFRFFLMAALTYNHNIYAILKVPHRDFSNTSFYTSIFFSFVKYTTYASECWIWLDGLITSYKLMSYLKKHNDYSIKAFLKFYFYSSTRTVVFFLIFFLFHVYAHDFGILIGKTAIYDYFIKSSLNSRICKQQPLYLLIPFYLQYFQNPQKNLHNCYRFTYIYLNEFTSLTMVMIIFYLAYRFRSKLFETVITSLLILNILFSFLAYSTIQYEETYNFNIFLGETLSYKYTHLFFNTYFIGVFVGLIYFYYHDVISTNPLETTENYIPFYFNFIIMKKVDSSKTLKTFLFFISIIAQITISMSFYFLLLFYGEKEKKLTVPINWLVKFLYMYEKKIFLFFFILMVITVLLYPQITSFKHLLHSNIFIPFNRVSFIYMCVLDSSVYLFYAIYNLQIYLNYQNIFFLTIGLIILIFWISFFFTILFELPFKILYRRLLRKIEKNKLK